MKNIVEISENGIEVLEQGNDSELVKAWNNNSADWIGWINEQEPEKYQAIKKQEIKELSQLEELIDEELDYSWNKLAIMTNEELEELKNNA